MPTESPKTISVKRSNVRSPAGNLPFGEIATTEVNGQMVYAPKPVQSHGQRLDTQGPEGGSKRGEEVAMPGHNVGEVNSTATGMSFFVSRFKGIPVLLTIADDIGTKRA